MDVDKLIAQSSFINIPLPKSSSSPILYSVCGKSKIQWYSDNNNFKDLSRIDGQPTEFEWKIFPGLTTVLVLNQIQQMMGELLCEPKNFTGRIFFMSMFNDIVWDVKGNDELCENNSRQLNIMLVDSLASLVFPRAWI